MKKKSSIILHSLFFVICSVLAVLCLYHIISIRRLNVKYTPAMTEESSRELDNPYRGFYQLSGYILSDNQKPEKSAAWCRKSCASNPYPLMLLEINLKNYSNTSISTNAQNQLDKILEECVRAKKQVILRFLYDWDGQALSMEPSDLPQIKNHISQISSTVNKYADCVYILQGTLTGNTGEMNHSNYGDINQIRQIIEALDQNISSDIFLAVRTPGQLRGILRTRTPLSSTDAGNGSLQARLSLFNDGMLGSVYDLGTYDDTPLQSDSNLDEQGTRSEELLFQYKLGKSGILFLSVTQPICKPPYQFEQCNNNQERNNVILVVQLALSGLYGIGLPAKSQFLAGNIITITTEEIRVCVFFLTLGS